MTLPAWVYDMVIALEEERTTHPTLYFQSGAFEGYARYERCTCWPLNFVPREVVREALVIRDYKQSVTGEDQSSNRAPAGHNAESGEPVDSGTKGGSST